MKKEKLYFELTTHPGTKIGVQLDVAKGCNNGIAYGYGKILLEEFWEHFYTESVEMLTKEAFFAKYEFLEVPKLYIHSNEEGRRIETDFWQEAVEIDIWEESEGKEVSKGYAFKRTIFLTKKNREYAR